ncbi:sigma-54-dependent Fis family transcriptional regulator [Candidatus Magnetobacterium casense]|uniref:sigma-54-dependent Fis family transcriptional regulator n=1 Tax=Candidatus Magnetobacterium casense TaxID=1455061 RepID=UPI00058D6F2D|nr:sigma-54-dependent Fis family transcriptional regulator [Candidatus Magnetobacterium casensis]
MRRDTAELNVIYEISKLLGSSLDIHRTLKMTMKFLCVFLDLKRATVALIEDNELVIRAAHGLSRSEIELGRYKKGEGIMGQVAKSGYPIVIPNIKDEPFFLNKTGARPDIASEDAAFLCVPVKFGREILGVLSVDRPLESKGISLDDDLRLLKIVSALIAQAVRLHGQVQQEKQELIAQRDALKFELKGKYSIDNVVGNSAAMQVVYEAVHRVAPSRATVMLMGESGTGKELIARAIHYMGPRANEQFVKLNCASIPEGLLEAELFGHEKGAFTGAANLRKGRFELAHKGTIFLDEIADLTSSLQPKLLRVLQEREFERIGSERTIKVDVRVIAATSRDLEGLVREGKFREDLYYRLNVVPVTLPPLRHRREDIGALIEFFLDKFNAENVRQVNLSPDALRLMLEYQWPGNVRELENAVERMVIMTPEDVVVPERLPLNIRASMAAATPVVGVSGKALPLLQLEKTHIIEALVKTGWVYAQAARVLGITPRQICYKVKKYGIRQDIS